MFGDSIITGIVPFLAKGKDEMHNVVKICRKAIAFLDKRADSDAAETEDDKQGESMRCLRVLTMISDPYCMLWPHVVDAFESTLIYSQTPPGGSCMPSMLPSSRRPSRTQANFSSTSKSLRAKTFMTHWRRRSSCNTLCRACQCSWPSAKRRSMATSS